MNIESKKWKIFEANGSIYLMNKVTGQLKIVSNPPSINQLSQGSESHFDKLMLDIFIRK